MRRGPRGASDWDTAPGAGARDQGDTVLTVLGGPASLAGIVPLTVEVGRLAVDADLAFHRGSGRAARAAH